MTPVGTCAFCGEPVNFASAAYPIRGWEVSREQGGANRILARERIPGMVAHPACVKRNTEQPGQGRLAV